MRNALHRLRGRVGAFTAGGAPGRVQGGNGTVLRLLFAEFAFAASDDLGRVFRHRYVLAWYFALSLPVVLIFVAFSLQDVLAGPFVPPVVMGVAAMLWVVAGYVALVRRVLRWFGSGWTLLLTPGFVIGAPVIVLTATFVREQIGAEHSLSMLQMQVMSLVLIAYLELAGTVLLRGPVPRAVAQLRAAQRVVVPPVQPTAPPDLQAPDAEAPQSAAPDEAVPAAMRDLLRLEARGNYVEVVTTNGRHLLPGPFAAMVERLPQDHGRRVHRSHWVAGQAVAGWRKAGRSFVILTMDGAAVPVASGLVGKIEPWVRSIEKTGRKPPAGAAKRAETPSRSGEGRALP